MRTPIIIFGFNRPDAFSRMVDSLRANAGFDTHPIHVFIDGPRNDNDKPAIEEVIRLAHELTPNVETSEINRGLGNSIIYGVSKIISQYRRAIILEDDLILMPGFLQYMENALDAYKDDNRIFSICGYGLKIKRPDNYVGDVYLCNRSSSWGWATWADRWKSVDWNVSDWDTLRLSPKLQRKFNRGGSDMYGMLKDYMEGRNKSWAIRFCYSQFRQGKYSVHPFQSLVANEGFGANATNCHQKYNRFKIELSETAEHLNLPTSLQPSDKLINASARYHSLGLRIYSRIRKLLNI